MKTATFDPSRHWARAAGVARRGRGAFALPIVLAVACGAAALQPAVASTASEPVVVQADFAPAAMAPQLVIVADNQALKGLKRVAVTQFTVSFVTFDSAQTQTSGFGAAGRASASAAYKLVGVGQPEFQALAGQLHAAFVRQLEASGLEVVPTEQVLAAPSHRKLSAAGTPLPAIGDESTTVAAFGNALYGTAKLEATTQKKAGLFSGFAAFGDAMSVIGSVNEVLALQKELGDVATLEVAMRVHFARLTDHNRGFFGRMASSAQVSGQAFPQLSSVSVSVQQGPVVATLSLKQPLAFDPGAFKEVREEPKTGADVAGAVLGGLIRLASGSNDRHSSARYEAVADPERWRETLASGIGQAGAMFAERMKAER